MHFCAKFSFGYKMHPVNRWIAPAPNSPLIFITK